MEKEKIYIEKIEDATGQVTFTLSIRSHEELFGSQPKNVDNYVCIEETEVMIAIDENISADIIELKLQDWLLKSSDQTRGVAVKVRDVVAKLKRLNFVPLPQKGTSHLHFLHPDGKAKVTVPIHCGEIAKGTFKSILNQAGLDLKTFQVA